MQDIMGLEPGAGLPDPRHQDLFDYWHAKCAGRIAPPRQAIDPVDLTALLPNLFIFKVYEEPERDYEPTLLGTALVSVLGRDFTGSRFYEMYHGESAKILRRQYDHVVDSHQPFYAQLDAEWMNKDFISYDRLLLPLSEGGETVSRLLGCSFFTRKDR